MNNKYEVALVVGNGFDLNLGLKTSYSDYLESDIFRTFFSDASANTLRWELNEEYSRNKEKELKWIDLEVFLKKFFGDERERDNPRKEFEDLVENISLYLQSIDLKENDIDVKSQSFKLLNSIKDRKFIILNFNYTNSVFRILSKLNVSEQKISTNLIHVHGTLDENNIIIGVDEKFKHKRVTSFLRKASNESFINNDVNEIFENSLNIIFFGHSLGETDHSYFDDFLVNISKERQKQKKGIFIFYHGSNDWYNKTYEISLLTNDRFKKLMDYNKLLKFDTSKKTEFSFDANFMVESTIKWQPLD